MVDAEAVTNLEKTMQLNSTLRILFLTNGCLVVGVTAVTPIYALFAEAIGASVFEVGVLAAVLFFGKTIGLTIMALWGDVAVHKARLYIWGFALQTAAWLLLVLADDLWLLYVVQILIGLSYALSVPAFRMLVATHLDHGHELYDYSTWEMILAFTSMVGGLLGGLVVAQTGFTELFLGLGIAGIVLTSTTWWLRDQID